MRLSKIKLSGFKTFVEPTTLLLPSNLVGIVGPNGCGKSNVIDAVRWVLGESSAKYLRGESMSDVIFNGSSTRKPVSSASIELFFDNTDKKLGGEYANYNEISTRRVITRDGQSQYFLNGTKCRRKDITSLFLGTGLGPRSYAIVQQEMISGLIEGKPEEMRLFLEEAAGISKYKQKRKETESRIKNTKENLNRLNDLKDEIEKQIQRLKKQANDAGRYTTLKQREKQIAVEIILSKIKVLNEQVESNKSESKQYQNAFDDNLTFLRKVEADIEEARIKDSQNSDSFNNKQKQHFELQANIARLEQSIEYEKELESQKTINAEDLKQELIRLNIELKEDIKNITLNQTDLIGIEKTNQDTQILVNALQLEVEALDQQIAIENQNNELTTNELNRANTIIETENVKITILTKQLLNTAKQKITIENLNNIKTAFSVLKVEVNKSKEAISKQGIEIIETKIFDIDNKLENLTNEFQSIENEITTNEKELIISKENYDMSKNLLGNLETKKENSDKKKSDQANNRNTLKQKLNSLLPKAHSLEVQIESKKSAINAFEIAINRIEIQITQLKAKSLEITNGPIKQNEQENEIRKKLESLLNKSLDSESELNLLRKETEDSQSQLRNLEIDRTNINSKVNQSRDELDQYKLKEKELDVRTESLNEQLQDSSYSNEELESFSSNLKSEKDLHDELEKILKSIDRLGPINLAASSEYELETERKDKLDSQFDDLNRALETLTGAIKQIDDESKIRFNETFEKVNLGLQKHFPKLFEGGKAYLELENNDALEGGVFVMARPPGKRNSNIHLLSGGEKALTAVALLFSIFELNPAPFCLLDEVDAPLDDNNVGRFCQIVKEMSSTVQFVVITHNKTTMELTKQLIGVTMSEPGVSRLVSVDLDEAVALTEEVSPS
ncbi:MAG: AAA family ATPase [Gammaproteobacteria bacterium]|nr:AAA family ATPase [Gammaproteobacteria bacterium]